MNRDASLTSATPPPWLWPRAAYIHIPFCATRCNYCDFAIAIGQDELIDSYLEALALELATLGEPQPVDTLFLGGGTPSQLRVSQLERLLRDILHWLPPRSGHEFSLEANPDSLTTDKIGVLADHGVTRISLGVQSFQSVLLQALERGHRPEQVPQVVEHVKGRIAQVSLDLIFGVPRQTLRLWEDDLRQALALQPDHLATYGLTYEKGTPLWKSRQHGRVQPLDEETERALYACSIDTLEAAGWEHYELSNFARPGGRCRHNAVYWANEAYFGFGMGAARYIHGRRELNTRSLQGYIARLHRGESATFQAEELSPDERARETVALGLRRAEGVHRQTFRQQTGFDLDALCGEAITRYVGLEVLVDEGERVRLTRQGKFVADAVITGLL